MEKAIRQNIYAIAVISFCIGVLYGLRAHAESATVTRDSTNSLIAGMQEDSDCKDAQADARAQLKTLDDQAKFAKKEEDEGVKAISENRASVDGVNAVRQHRIDELTSLQNAIAKDLTTINGLKRCSMTDGVPALLKDADAASKKISTKIAEISGVISASAHK